MNHWNVTGDGLCFCLDPNAYNAALERGESPHWFTDFLHFSVKELHCKQYSLDQIVEALDAEERGLDLPNGEEWTVCHFTVYRRQWVYDPSIACPVADDLDNEGWEAICTLDFTCGGFSPKEDDEPKAVQTRRLMSRGCNHRKKQCVPKKER